jgi:hypothetical protein
MVLSRFYLTYISKSWFLLDCDYNLTWHGSCDQICLLWTKLVVCCIFFKSHHVSTPPHWPPTNGCPCYDLRPTADTMCKAEDIFIFLCMFCWTFHFLFYSSVSSYVLHVVPLPTYFHLLVSFNDILTPIYLALYARFSNMFCIYLNKNY